MCRLALLIPTAMLAAACGSETANQTDTTSAATAQQTAKAAPANACALLPAAEVSSVLEVTVRDTLAMQMDGGAGGVNLSQCNYTSSSNALTASLMLRRSAPGETVAQGSKSARETLAQSGVTAEDVPGLGEVAFWGGNQLHVFTNNGWYLIVSPSASGGLPQARALAERALGRL